MTQCEKILSHMVSRGPITPIEALMEYQCFRLAARIEELRRAGNPIRTDLIGDGKKKYASYSLESVHE